MQKFFNVKDVASHLGVSLGTVYGAIDRGELKAHRFGRKTALRVSEESLQKYIDDCAEEQPHHLPTPTGSFQHLRLK
jgi:excisionase family DNA binding protein